MMGIITVTTVGSFGQREKSFSAMEHGHADAVAKAIEYLSGDLLPSATAQDHMLHEQGERPQKGFNRLSPNRKEKG